MPPIGEITSIYMFKTIFEAHRRYGNSVLRMVQSRRGTDGCMGFVVFSPEAPTDSNESRFIA